MSDGFDNSDRLKELEKKLEKLMKLFDNHLNTMSEINGHMGYKFSQPLINARLELDKIKGL